jgi:ABC-type amino acid transport system permease subunit
MVVTIIIVVEKIRHQQRRVQHRIGHHRSEASIHANVVKILPLPLRLLMQLFSQVPAKHGFKITGQTVSSILLSASRMALDQFSNPTLSQAV